MEDFNSTRKALFHSTNFGEGIDKFIDLSVHLENYKGFPENQTIDLYKEVRKNRFAQQILRHLIWHYFYIYPAKRELKESICQRLEIQITQAIKAQHQKLLTE